MGFWERYRPKPFWRSEYREAYLEQAGRNLLLAFVLSISLNPFYVIIFADRDSLNYVFEDEVFVRPDGVYFPSSYTPSQSQALERYQKINKEEIQRINEFERQITWISITALLGWCVTSPRFMRGWNRIKEKIQNGK